MSVPEMSRWFYFGHNFDGLHSFFRFAFPHEGRAQLCTFEIQIDQLIDILLFAFPLPPSQQTTEWFPKDYPIFPKNMLTQSGFFQNGLNASVNTKRPAPGVFCHLHSAFHPKVSIEPYLTWF